jgi:DNA polymerase-1
VKINPGSDDEVGRLLFGRLGLPILERTDSGAPSTEAEVLEKLAKVHPVVPLIMSFREVKTYLSRYATGMRKHVRGDGRVHPTFNLDGTRTGRWSSADPNFQNLAEHAELAKWVKRYLVARPGYLLMAWDFSQLEYVVASIISGDQVMQQIFKDGKDMHRRTAELIGPILWNIAVEIMAAMTKDEIAAYRQKAKAVNFGALFNMQASTLARQLGCSEQDAQKLLKAILYDLFTGFASWRDNEIRIGQQRGYSLVYSVSEGGDLIPVRRRPLVGLASTSRRVVGNAINALVNTPVQGSAAIMQVKAITAIDKWLLDSGMFERREAAIVNAIHDATYLEVREDLVHKVYANVTPRMVNQPTRGVPLRVDCKVGRDLASMVPYSEWK